MQFDVLELQIFVSCESMGLYHYTWPSWIKLSCGHGRDAMLT